MEEKVKKPYREKVVVFGQEVSDSHVKDHPDMVFGVAIFLAGIILLLNSLGIVSWTVWQVIRVYWPLLLILWGIQIILGRNPLSRFVVLIISFLVLASLFVYTLKDQIPGILEFVPQKFIEWSNYWEVIKSQ